MDLTGLEKLKEIVATSKDLSAAFHYFMDHFGENETFLRLGKPKPHPLLEQLIAASAGQILRATLVVEQFFLIPIPKTRFIHGAGLVNRWPTNVLYFDDIQVGIIAIMRGLRGPIQYSRFSARLIPPETVPSNN
jgi:hypothetical protein